MASDIERIREAAVKSLCIEVTALLDILERVGSMEFIVERIPEIRRRVDALNKVIEGKAT